MTDCKNCRSELDAFAARLKEFGVVNEADWLAIVLFIRNLLAHLTIYTDEKKAEIQQEICDQLLRKDFSEAHLETIMAMLDGYIMQNIGSLELEEALAQEKKTAALLLNEMHEMIASMHGADERRDQRLTSFQEEAVEAIQDGDKKSLIVSKVRGMFREIIEEFREEARELSAKAEHFRLTAEFDPMLTDMHNRRSFEAYLKQAEEELAEHPLPLSMMMIDVDHFKKVNDTHGHQAGDDVLRALARIINTHAVQYGGFAARYGGEELAVVVKNMDLQWAVIKAEAIRMDVENYDFRVRTNGRLADAPINFTVSVGVAQLQPGQTMGDLIGAADTALYKAKNTGRNRVCCLPELA